MTERLSALLRDEAAALDIPPVDHAAILARGRQTGTPRRGTTWLAAAAAVAILGAGTALVLDGDGDRRPDDRAGDPAAEAGPSRGVLAYGADSTVVVDGTTATVPDTVRSLYYTSVGVLTLSNPNAGWGPGNLTLVTSEGSATDLGTIPERVVPATDPDEPVYALAEKSGDGFRVVVHDALTGAEVGSRTLPSLPMSYWPSPPLALDGDIVYAGFEDEAYALNWRTGEMQPAAGLAGGMPQVLGGFSISYAEDALTVVDAASGASAVSISMGDGAYGTGSLSPDGAYLRFGKEPGVNKNGDLVVPDSVDIYDIASGERVRISGDVNGWGWTSGGFLVRVEGTSLDICDPLTGRCTTETGPRIGKDVRLAGNAYER